MKEYHEVNRDKKKNMTNLIKKNETNNKENVDLKKSSLKPNRNRELNLKDKFNNNNNYY